MLSIKFKSLTKFKLIWKKKIAKRHKWKKDYTQQQQEQQGKHFEKSCE